MKRWAAMLAGGVLCLGATSVVAEPGPVGPSEKGWVDRARRAVPETERRRAVEGFCASLVISTDASFLETWDRPSEILGDEGTETVQPGTLVLAIIIFANPALDASGEAHLSADFSLLRPDGSVYGETRNLTAWEGPLPAPNILELTRKYLRVRLEAGDPSGTYAVEATLHDTVSGHTLTLRAPLEVGSFQPEPAEPASP